MMENRIWKIGKEISKNRQFVRISGIIHQFYTMQVF
jgi:hypothetical protein